MNDCPALQGNAASCSSTGKLGICCNDPCIGQDAYLFSQDAQQRRAMLKSMALTMQDKTFCKICLDTEASGNKSTRQWLNSRPDDYDLTINVGNVCNLRCVMCRPEYSNLLSQDMSALPPELTAYYKMPKMPKFSLAKNKRNQIERFISSIHQPINLNVIGGEPLADTDIIEWLTDCLKNFSNIKIMRLNTNLTFNDRRTMRLAENEKVHITASIDGHEDSFEWSRFGAAWDRIEQNVPHYKNVLGDRFAVHTTVHAISILGDDLLTRWLAGLGIKQSKFILTDPPFLSLRILTDEERDTLKLWEIEPYDADLRRKFSLYQHSISSSRGKPIPNSIVKFYGLEVNKSCS